MLFGRDREEFVKAEHNHIAETEPLFLVNVHQGPEGADWRFSGSNTQNAELAEFLFFADAIFDFTRHIHRTVLFGGEDCGVDFLEFTNDIFGVGTQFFQFVVSGCHF